MSMITTVICDQCGECEHVEADLGRKAAKALTESRQQHGWLQIGSGRRREDFCPACAKLTIGSRWHIRHQPRTAASVLLIMVPRC